MNNIGNPMLSGVVDDAAVACVINDYIAEDDAFVSTIHADISAGNNGYAEQNHYAGNNARIIDEIMAGGVKFAVAAEEIIDFNIYENREARSITYEMVDGMLYAMPKKEITVGAEGVHSNQIIRVGLRYTSGVHHNTPVRPCPKHADMSDPGFSFSIPKLNVNTAEIHPGHKMKEFRTPPDTNGSFCFSTVFYCLNSCHGEFGKGQELVLHLCDQWGSLLKEKKIEVRICKNVNRDKKEKQGTKRSAGKVKSRMIKKVKTEMDERVQGGASGVMTFPYILSGTTRALVTVPTARIPFFTEFVQLLGGNIERKEDVDESSSGDLTDTI